MKNTITATAVPENHRLAFLPQLVGARYMLHTETAITRMARQMCQQYDGGYWEFYALSNGGGYMAPRMRNVPERGLDVESINQNSALMSPDALGIACCLFAFSHLSFEAHERNDETSMDLLSDAFHNLREFAQEHTEARAIFAIID